MVALEINRINEKDPPSCLLGFVKPSAVLSLVLTDVGLNVLHPSLPLARFDVSSAAHC